VPVFAFKSLLYSTRIDFLKALAVVRRGIEYPQALTVYDDLAAFSEWRYEVPEAAWWVDWQSFNVEGKGNNTVRPLPHGRKAQGQYLGKFQNGGFQPSTP
jgi:hypothetical protein